MTALNTKAMNKKLAEMKADAERRKSLEADRYNYEWQTIEDILANLNTLRKFNCWGTMTLSEISTNPEDFRNAHALWLKLKEKFNAEAATYKPEKYDSKLGSVGDVKKREVLRSAWWDEVEGDKVGDYRTLTNIIETLHHGEELETGTIIFGS